MSLVIVDSGGVNRDVMEVQDFAAAKFACIAGVAEPIVSSNPSVDGTGSSANPLAVNPSTDALNAVVLGTDGRIYVPTPAVYSFDITDGITTEPMASGDTLTFAGSNEIQVVVSAVDTVTISNVRPAQAPACGLGYFTGV